MARKDGTVGETAGSQGIEPVPMTPETPRGAGIAAFLWSVSQYKDGSGPCPCERCCDYRDMSRMIMNPGSQY